MSLPMVPLKVLALQLPNRDAAGPADVSFNLRLAQDAIATDRARGVDARHDVYCLCEMVRQGFSVCVYVCVCMRV